MVLERDSSWKDGDEGIVVLRCKGRLVELDEA